jgi:hypothetical protein
MWGELHGFLVYNVLDFNYDGKVKYSEMICYFFSKYLFLRTEEYSVFENHCTKSVFLFKIMYDLRIPKNTAECGGNFII